MNNKIQNSYQKPFRILLIGASGYLGSRLAKDIVECGWEVDGCDVRKPIEGSRFRRFFEIDFSDIDLDCLDDYAAVLWFAGHSTVGKCVEDPVGSVENNFTNLLKLAEKLHKLGVPLVYASTASLYSSSSNEFSLIADERRANIYDSGKLSFDIVLNALGYRAIGLRLATVAGWSPHIRWETIFNAMNRSAYLDGRVFITNPSNFRGLIFTDEFSVYVLHLLKLIKEDSFFNAPTQIPLSCWSGSIGSLGAEIANFWGVPLEFGPDSGTYSFVLPDKPLHDAVGNSKNFYRSISERCHDFALQMNWDIPKTAIRKQT